MGRISCPHPNGGHSKCTFGPADCVAASHTLRSEGDSPKVQSASKSHDVNFHPFRMLVSLNFAFDDPNWISTVPDYTVQTKMSQYPIVKVHTPEFFSSICVNENMNLISILRMAKS